MRRTTNHELERLLNLENVVFRGNTEEVNAASCADPVFKHPTIPAKYPICYFWLCKRTTTNDRKEEFYWVFWTRGEQKPTTSRYIMAEDPISLIKKGSHHHRDLVDSLWVSGSEYPKYECEMEVDDVDFRLSMELFKKNEHFQGFTESMRSDDNLGNWRERIFKMVVKTRIEYYQERYRLSRNDHYLKMALFWRHLDWKVISTEHFSVMVMCFFKQMSLGFVEKLFRTHYT